MKVCYINYLSPSIIHGGAERVVLEEARMIADSGSDVLVVSLKHDKSIPDLIYLHDRKIRNVFIPYMVRLPRSTLGKGIDILRSLFNPLPMIHLKELLAFERPDVVHIHQLGPMSICALAAFKGTGVGIVQTFHGCNFECPTGSLVKQSGAFCNKKRIVCRIYSILYRMLMKPCDLIIAISPHIKKQLVGLGYDPSRIMVLPNSVTTERTIARKKERKFKEILFVGRMTKVKGVHTLIKALRNIKRRYVANLIGTGEHLEYFKSLAKQLKVHARFLGMVPDEILKKYYESADVVVVPSLFPELCSMVILEAMSYGKPVIASELGGNPYLVLHGKTGYLFAPGDEEKLAKYINNLISNEKITSEMGSRSLRRVREFSRRAHTGLLLNAYNEVSKNGRSSRE